MPPLPSSRATTTNPQSGCSRLSRQQPLRTNRNTRTNHPSCPHPIAPTSTSPASGSSERTRSALNLSEQTSSRISSTLNRPGRRKRQRTNRYPVNSTDLAQSSVQSVSGTLPSTSSSGSVLKRGADRILSLTRAITPDPALPQLPSHRRRRASSAALSPLRCNLQQTSQAASVTDSRTSTPQSSISTKRRRKPTAPVLISSGMDLTSREASATSRDQTCASISSDSRAPSSSADEPSRASTVTLSQPEAPPLSSGLSNPELIAEMPASRCSTFIGSSSEIGQVPRRLEELFDASFGGGLIDGDGSSIPIVAGESLTNGATSQVPSNGLPTVDPLGEFLLDTLGDGSGRRWRERIAGLESSDPAKQGMALAELAEWLTYSTAEMLRSSAIEKVVAALVNILEGRRHASSAKSAQVIKSDSAAGSRRKKNLTVSHEVPPSASDEDWVAVNPATDKTKKFSEEPEDESKEEWEDEDDENSGGGNETSYIDDDEEDGIGAARKLNAAECLQYILEGNPLTARFFMEDRFFDVFCKQLGRIEYIDIGERIVMCLHYLAPEVPHRLLKAGAVASLLEFVDFYPAVVQQNVAMTVCTLLCHVYSSDAYTTRIKPCVTQLSSLLKSDSEDVLRWSVLGLRVLVEGSSSNTKVLSEVLEDLTNSLAPSMLLNLLQRLIDDNSLTPVSDRSMSTNGYLVAMDSLYLLAQFTAQSVAVTRDLLDAKILNTILSLLSFQVSAGQDSFIILHTAALLSSMLPPVQLLPNNSYLIAEPSPSRVICFTENPDRLEFLCKQINPIFVSSLEVPSVRDTGPSILSFIVSLTALIKRLDTTAMPKCMTKQSAQKWFSDSLGNGLGLISSLAAILAVSKISPHATAFSVLPASKTATFAALLVVSHVMVFDPTKFGPICYRSGILRSTLSLSCVLETDKMNPTELNWQHMLQRDKDKSHKGNTVMEVPSNSDLKLRLELIKPLIWSIIIEQFEKTESKEFRTEPSQVPPGFLVNITRLIQWLACTVATSLLDQQMNIVQKKKIVSLSDIASTLKSAANNDILSTREALAALRERILSCEGITAFEAIESGILQSLCEYLFTSVVPAFQAGRKGSRDTKFSSRGTISQQKQLQPNMRQLQEFVNELCNDKHSKDCHSQDSTAWKGAFLLRQPADVRALLVLTKLFVECVDYLEQLPMTLLCMTNPPSIAVSSLTVNDQNDGCPRHLSFPKKSQTATVSAEMKFSPLNQPVNASAVVSSNLQDARYAPQEMLDFLGTELKLRAGVSVGESIMCALSFSLATKDDDSMLPIDELNDQDRILCSRTERAIAALATTPAEGKDGGHFASQIPRCVVLSCEVANPSSISDPPKTGSITLVLQLSTDVRTTASLLQQSLSGHVERQIRWLSRKSEADSDNKNGNPTDQPILPAAASSEGCQRLLTISVNGHIIPAHMTLGEGLCRFSNAVFLPRRCFNSHSETSKKEASHQEAIEHPTEVDADEGAAAALSRGEKNDSSRIFAGYWLVLHQDRIFCVCSEQYEKSRLLKFETKSDSDFSTSRRGSTRSDLTVSDVAGATTDLAYRPMWDVEHKLSANLTAEQDISKRAEAQLSYYRQLLRVYIRKSSDSDVGKKDEIFLRDWTSSNPATVELPTKDGEHVTVKIHPLPNDTKFMQNNTACLSDGSLLVSLGEVLSHLQLRRCCQVLGLRGRDLYRLMTVFGPPEKSTSIPEAITGAAETEVRLNSEQMFAKLLEIMKIMDVSAITSPIMCTSVKGEFSQAGLCESLSSDLHRAALDSHTLNEDEQMTPSEAGTAMGAGAAPNVPSIMDSVIEQMQFLRGWPSSLNRKDVLLSAGLTEYLALSKDETQVQLVQSDSNIMLSGAVSGGECSRFESDAAHDVDDDDEEADEDGDEDEDESCSAGEDVEMKDGSEGETPGEGLLIRQAEDIAGGQETLAASLQLVLCLIELTEVVRRSNFSLFCLSPEVFMTDIGSASPIYFPSIIDIQQAQLSAKLTAKALKQLSDPIAVASVRVPKWLIYLVQVAPPLFSLTARRLLHMSTSQGSLVGVAAFRARVRKDLEALGCLQLPSAIGRRPRISVKSSLAVPSSPISSSVVAQTGSLNEQSPVSSGFTFLNEFEDDEISDRPDPTLVDIGKAVYRLHDFNRRKQLRRAHELDPILTRQRTKIRVTRNQSLLSAPKVLDYFHCNNNTSALPSTMEVEFIDEEGTGSGPTLEFYAEVFDELVAMENPRLFRIARPNGYLFPMTHCICTSSSVLAPFLQRPVTRATPMNESSNTHTTNTTDPPASGPGSANHAANLPTTGLRGDSDDSAVAEQGRPALETASKLSESTTKQHKCAMSTIERANGSEFSDIEKLSSELFAQFKLMGQMFAKALCDSRLIDFPLHPIFWKLVLTPPEHWSILCDEAALNLVDPTLYKHVCQLREMKKENLENLEISFVLPGSSPEIELIPNGRNIYVNSNNLETFVKRCCEWVIWRGVALQVWAFRFGIATFIPLMSLQMFTPTELGGGVLGCASAIDKEEFWSLIHLKQAIVPDHGYTNESRIFKSFLEIINELDKSQRRLFLKFCTGASILPRGGFIALRPGMKVVKKHPSSESPKGNTIAAIDSMLPSVMACTNYIKLPDYSSKEQMRLKLLFALNEGQGAFALS